MDTILLRSTVTLYQPIYQEDDNARLFAMRHIHSFIIDLAHNEKSNQTNNTNQQQNTLQRHLLMILRLSLNCPFADVRTHCVDLLEEMKQMGIKIPRPIHQSPSFFIQKSKVVGFENKSATQSMIACFLATGRLSNVNKLMAYFPDFFQQFVKTYNQIMRMQGPLPLTWRNYIAIMAASQNNCQYLVSIQSNDFSINGGDSDWLKGLENAPLKLQKLAELNALMAHRPWEISKNHIYKLTKGSDNWGKSELVQAILVLSTFHGLSSFVLGCGVVPELDMQGGTFEYDENTVTREDTELSDPTSPILNVELLSRLMKKTHDEPDILQSVVFEQCDTQETFPNSQEPDSHSDISADPVSNLIFQDLNCFKGPYFNEKYANFEFKSKYSVFRINEFSWEDHGCAAISKFLKDVSDLLDTEFNVIQNMTDYSIFASATPNVVSEGVDTWPVRQAVWYYVLRLFGMSHDDYNYHEVNIYLNRKIKEYIKKVACYPETVVRADFLNMGFGFRSDEKCHINLLASESRKCAELLYVLRALDES